MICDALQSGPLKEEDEEDETSLVKPLAGPAIEMEPAKEDEEAKGKQRSAKL